MTINLTTFASNAPVVAPDGARYETQNLRVWCESNAKSFQPHGWERAYKGLRVLASAARNNRRVERWRGWRLAALPERPANA